MRILKLTQVDKGILIYHQILLNNLQGNELKLEGRIDPQILRIKGLNVKSSVCWILYSCCMEKLHICHFRKL